MGGRARVAIGKDESGGGSGDRFLGFPLASAVGGCVRREEAWSEATPVHSEVTSV